MDRPGLVGQTLSGRYRIDELIGQGGMAAVYKAYDPNLQRVVAVKTIKEDKSADPKFVSRFESEATAVAQLRHENIVQVYDFSHEDGLYYMVQEFVAGETLRDRLHRLSRTERKMPLDEAVRCTIDILKAVGYAHRRGMIHRDIKPANIMLDVHDRAVLMDFGIVKITGSTEHTVAGAVIGTAVYMAPEQIRGEVPDARSDIYSLGVTLYEMLSGQPPFEADSAMSLLMMHLQEPVPDLQKIRPDLPQALVDVVRRALAKDREGRYNSAAEMADALERVLPQIEADLAVHIQATQINAPVTPGPTQAESLPRDLGRDTARESVGDTAREPGLDSGPAPGWVSGTLAETPLTDRQPEPRQTAPGSQAAPASQGGPALQGGPARRTAPSAPSALPETAPAARPAKPRFGPRRLWLGAAGLLGVVILGLALVLLLGGGNDSGADAAAEPTASATAAVAVVEDPPLPTAAATATASPTDAPLPTATPPSLPVDAQATFYQQYLHSFSVH
ncbi:MAG: protein kinase [Anaerolineae bacterium]